MKYELINNPNSKYTAKQQILINRGIKEEDIYHYMNTTDDDINSPITLGLRNLENAAKALTLAFNNNYSTIIIVDADCDGYTSAALLTNYLYEIVPSFVTSSIDFFIHSGKQHGLADCIDKIEEKKYKLVIIPDASSNDYEYHKRIHDYGGQIIILDHHEADFLSQDAYVINNQLSLYPNKELSGVGITWQFCRYLDSLMKTNYAENYYDLVALGNMADMMSLKSLETKHLIQKGFLPENIKNSFIFEIWQKNKFKLGEHITPMGAAFYIAPFVNAMVRSGEQEEKELLFNSMLKHKAFQIIPSTKRGHSLGETEKLVEQAVRTATNVKNRQTRAEDAGMELIENQIYDNNMLNHKVLLFLLNPGEIDKNIAGLIANKIMAKYQRPCCILTKVQKNIHHTYDEFPNVVVDEYITTYEGSARGCDKVGINEFKNICEQTGVINYAVGHQGAFGLGILASEINNFIKETDNILKDMADEAIYYVDYIWNVSDIDPTAICDIAEMSDIWGKDMDEALVAIQGIQITKDMLSMMKSNTVKISLPNVNIIKFRMSDEEYEKLYSEQGYIEIDAICRCNINEWNGIKSAQLFLEAYNIVGSCGYVF